MSFCVIARRLVEPRTKTRMAASAATSSANASPRARPKCVMSVGFGGVTGTGRKRERSAEGRGGPAVPVEPYFGTNPSPGRPEPGGRLSALAVELLYIGLRLIL